MRLLRIIVLLCLSLGACAPAPQPHLQHEVYIWQRQWTPALRESIATATPTVAGWHVLAAEVGVDQRVFTVAVDFAALRASHRPVTAVIRIDGRDGHIEHYLPFIIALAARWQGEKLPLRAIEIDYDSATRQLPVYANFLRALRQQLPSHLALMNTALPAWLDSPALDKVLAASDSAVLQVHSVKNRQQGLFHAQDAQR